MLQPVRVLIVDDSATSRAGIARVIMSGAGLVVVGEVSTGEQALRVAAQIKPDIVLMDVVMSGMDGLEATRRLMSESPVPVLVVSALAGRDATLNFRALEVGALDIAQKPSRADIDDPIFCARFCRIVRALARVPVVTRSSRAAPAPSRGERATSKSSQRAALRPLENRAFQRLCIGASTGGPPALHALLNSLRPRPPWPVLIVQHITPGFVDPLARWLEAETGITVLIAEAGVVPEKGVVYLAPDGLNLRLDGPALALSSAPLAVVHRPSVDVLFDSVVTSGAAPSTLGVLLTGMGSDGAAGLRSLRDAGGYTIVQDESTSVVYGMPKAAVERDAAVEVLPLAEIGSRLLSIAPLSPPFANP